MFKTIEEDVSFEIVEKKSKFIADVFYVQSKEEAEEKIREIKKKYYDAKHHCFAYSIYEENGKLDRFSDDGEPSGTAGSPMLNILTSNNLSNVVAIVTRYFGGILLGTGGLVRAYSEALTKAIESAKIVEKDLGYISEVTVNYNDVEKIKYYFGQQNIKVIDINFDELVKFVIEISKDKYNELLRNKEELKFKIVDIMITKESYIDVKK